MEDQVPVIMENVFECTLEMINKLQQEVLDNNPIYKYLLSDVSVE